MPELKVVFSLYNVTKNTYVYDMTSFYVIKKNAAVIEPREFLKYLWPDPITLKKIYP